VPEYWVVDVAGRRVEVYTSPEPASGLYLALCTVRPVELLTSLSVPRLELPVLELFGG
jgi:Uma2 family endonuclease